MFYHIYLKICNVQSSNFKRDINNILKAYLFKAQALTLGKKSLSKVIGSNKANTTQRLLFNCDTYFPSILYLRTKNNKKKRIDNIPLQEFNRQVGKSFYSFLSKFKPV